MNTHVQLSSLACSVHAEAPSDVQARAHRKEKAELDASITKLHQDKQQLRRAAVEAELQLQRGSTGPKGLRVWTQRAQSMVSTGPCVHTWMHTVLFREASLDLCKCRGERLMDWIQWCCQHATGVKTQRMSRNLVTGARGVGAADWLVDCIMA